MAGSNPDFNPSEFRSAIKATMRMGMPKALDEQLKFHFKPVKEFVVQDPANQPYDWREPPTTVVPGNPEHPEGGLTVDYALEFQAANANNTTEVGRWDLSRATVTVLDEDYERVKTADYCTIGRTTYQIKFRSPAIGLFEVTTYQFFIEAEDQST